MVSSAADGVCRHFEVDVEDRVFHLGTSSALSRVTAVLSRVLSVFSWIRCETLVGVSLPPQLFGTQKIVPTGTTPWTETDVASA